MPTRLSPRKNKPLKAVKPLVRINNLSVAYGGQIALRHVSLTIQRGDFVILIGPNGAGKTTLVQTMVTALQGLPPRNALDHGNGKVVFDKSEPILLGYLPQQQKRLTDFPATSAEVILLGLLAGRGTPKFITRGDYKKIDASLHTLNISHLKHKIFSSLSGGQKQLVLLARALVAGGNFLIFDEPTTALDPVARQHFLTLLGHLNQQHQTTIIFITHDLADTKPYASKILYLDRDIKFLGTPKDFAAVERQLAQHPTDPITCHDHG